MLSKLMACISWVDLIEKGQDIDVLDMLDGSGALDVKALSGVVVLMDCWGNYSLTHCLLPIVGLLHGDPRELVF